MCKFIQFLRKKILLSPMDRVQLSLNVHFIYSESFNIYNAQYVTIINYLYLIIYLLIYLINN